MRSSRSADGQSTGDVLLEARGLCVGYGASTVVHDLDLTVAPGEVVALLGPNGAGKTSTLLALAGELVPRAGEVWMDGRRVRTPSHKRARAGMGYITEERSVFMGLSVADNLRVAGVKVTDALEIAPELEPFLKKKAGQLSGGQQQLLALARMLGRQPRLLLADELSLGLAPIVVATIIDSMQTLRDEGLALIVVDEVHQHSTKAMSSRRLVLEKGRFVSGKAAEDETEAFSLTHSS